MAVRLSRLPRAGRRHGQWHLIQEYLSPTTARDLPPGVRTVMSAVPTRCFGVVAEMMVPWAFSVNPGDDTAPNFTLTTSVSPVPITVMWAPPVEHPVGGETEVTTGWAR